MNKKSITDLNLLGKTVLVRVDYNVPMDETGRITDDSRIRETLPTLNYLMSQGARIVLMAHFGRPKGQVVESMRLAPVAAYLSELLGDRVRKEIYTVPNCTGAEVGRAVADLDETDILMLENLRFHPEEEKNDPAFAR